jgi:hypothetical protein
MEDGLWWSLQRKERKERVGEQQKKEREMGTVEEDSSLHSGPESEPGKTCCCLLLFRL